jgi:retinol dehydrogenase-12
MPNGKVAVITGATSGIGFVTARALARQNFRVVALGRDRHRATGKSQEILADVPDAQVDWVIADFSSLAQVRRAAKEIQDLTDRIDVLVNNAGLMLDRRSLTADGLETMFAVNHLAPFLLTGCLLTELKRAERAHVVNVSSIGHTMIDDMHWNDLQMERDFAPLTAYAQSKLGNVLFTREFARRFAGDGIISSAVHPGLVASRFSLTAGAGTIAFYEAARASGEALTEEQGADTVIWLASAPETALPSGGYFSERQRVEPSAAAQNSASAGRLWNLSEQLVAQLS